MIAVHVTTDVAEGEMLTEALRGEGIAACLDTVHGARLGVGPQVFQTKVLVPAADAPRARELLAELREVGESELADAAAAAAVAANESGGPAGVPAPDGDDAGTPAPRYPWRAAGIAFLLPGGGHLHARRTATAIVIELALLACLTAIILGRGTSVLAHVAIGALLALVVGDSIGGARASRAFNAGVRAGAGRQLANGVVLLVVAQAAGAAFAGLAMVPDWWQGRQLATLSASCTGWTIDVRNGDERTGQFVTIDAVVAGPLAGNWYRAQLQGATRLRLAPGAEGKVAYELRSYDLPPPLIAACAGNGDRLCELRFKLVADDDVPPGAEARHTEAIGRCTPRWNQPSAPAVPADLRQLRPS
jgi:hypothetical protein